MTNASALCLGVCDTPLPPSGNWQPLPIAHCLLPTAHCLLPTGYWLLATGYWLLATGYWLLANCSLA